MKIARLMATVLSGGSAWTPANISGLVQWIDFSRVSTLYQDNARSVPVTTNGQRVLSATDLSGAGNHLVEGFTNIGPAYTTNAQNGLSGANFDGKWLIANFTLNQPYTKIICIKNNSTAANRYFFDGRTAASGIIYRSAVPVLSMYAGATVASTIDPAADATFITGGVFNGASSVLYYNAETPVTGNVGAANAGGTTWGGRSDGGVLSLFYGFEFLTYSGVVSPANMALIRAYLNTKWAIY